jgi:hypothetical protein
MSTSTDSLAALHSFGERRFYPRTASVRPIYVAFCGKNLSMILNLGENGLLVSTPSGLTINSVYRVSLRLEGLPKPIDVQVRTIWTTELTKRAGIQFLDLSEFDREQIRKWQALEDFWEKSPEHSAPQPVMEPQRQKTPRALQLTMEPQRQNTPPPVLAPAPPAIPAFLAPMPATEPLRNTHLDSLVSRKNPVSRRRTRKSDASPLVTWTMLAAVICLGAALGLKPDLFGKLLHHLSTSSAPQIVDSSTAPPPPPTSSLDAQVPSDATQTDATPALPNTRRNDTVSRTAAASPSDSANSSSGAPANQLPMNRPPSQRPVPRFSLAKLKSPVGANNGPFPLEPNEVPAPVSDKAQPATVAKQLSALASPRLTDSLASLSPAAAPAPPGSLPAKSAITGSITGPGASTTTASTAAPPYATSVSPTTTPTWTTSGPPISAGRTSFFHSRSNSAAVVQMDATPGAVTEITPPRGLTASFVPLLGERVLDSPAVTMHVQRSVLVPGDHWVWRTHKTVVLGELTSRIDPQVSRPVTSGTITVQATIDKDGRVTNLKPLNGSFEFLPNVARALRAWRYEPTYLDNKPVETQAQIELDFHPPTRR